MKRLTRLFVFSTIVCFALTGRAIESNTISHSVSFDIDKLSLKTIEVEGTTYTELFWEGMHNQGKPGFPSLPTHSFNVSVPSDATDFSVSIMTNGSKVLNLPSLPYPTQYPALASLDYDKPPFVHLLSSSEYTSIVASTIVGEVTEVATIGGFNKTVSITVNPILWNANNQCIEILTDITINLSWNTDSEECKKLIVPRFQPVIDNAMEQTREIVINPEDVESNCSHLLKSRVIAQSESSNEYIPYIIVTTKDLESSLERLAALRRLRGFQTKIFCIEDILVDSRFAEGDFISGLNDDAGKLRSFLKYTYTKFGTQYVLLAGEYPKIPGRWAYYEREGYISDLYFRDLTTSWPVENNGFTDPDNLSGIGNDLHLGRINVSTTTELNNYIDKLIQYEFNIKNIDLSYLDHAFVLCGHDQYMTSVYQDYSLQDYSDNFKYLKHMFVPEEGIIYGHEAVESMRTDYWGYIDWRCHGHYGGVGTSVNPDGGCYGINALDADKAEFLEEDLNGLDTWANKDHPCWTLSMSCTTAQIGKVAMENKTYSFAESFLLGKNYGGITFIGNTGPGYTYYSSILIKNIFSQAINRYYSGIYLPLSSIILNEGIANSSSNVDSNHVKATIGLFGDPLVPLWMKQPMNSNVSGRFNPISLTETDFIHFSKHFLSDNSVTSGIGSIGNYTTINETLNHTLINSRSDMIPYIYPTNVSGLTISDDQYWFTGKLRFSSEQTKNTNILNEGVNLTIEALDEVTLEGEIELKSDSKIKIISYRPVSINKCELKGIGTINIDASGNVTIGNGTTIPKGISLTISKPVKK